MTAHVRKDKDKYVKNRTWLPDLLLSCDKDTFTTGAVSVTLVRCWSPLDTFVFHPHQPNDLYMAAMLESRFVEFRVNYLIAGKSLCQKTFAEASLMWFSFEWHIAGVLS